MTSSLLNIVESTTYIFIFDSYKEYTII